MKAPGSSALMVLVLVAGGATLLAQRQFGAFGFDPPVANPGYNGQFTFARIKYAPGPGGYYYRGIPAWSHGYVPGAGSDRAETNLMKIVNELTVMRPRIEDSVVVTLDDPSLFKYPIAYLTEPGYWTLSEQEAKGLGAYLLKGGFLIVDDFRHDGDPRMGGGWANLETNIGRAVPGGRLRLLEPSLPIFHCFFEIDPFGIIPQAYDQWQPELYGLFEDNDPAKRMLAIVNYSTDVSDFWEFSGTGFRPVEESNEAYQLGVNYLIYGLTH